MHARHLVLGLDGADLDVLFQIGKDRLPHLFQAMERGAYARLQSVLPPATLPNWSTFLTGLDPGQHGVFDFTSRQGYRVRFTGGTTRQAPTFFARLDALGLRTACIGFPATWPPEKPKHGIAISGWDSPVAFEADASFVWPRPLFERITRRFGPMRFDDADEFRADESDWHASLSDKLVARIRRKTEMAEWLIRSEGPFEIFALYFGESDTASHHLWPFFDPDSPRRPRHVSGPLADAIPRVYAALDEAAGRLLRAAGGDGVELTILSDHGSGGSSDKILHLNRALEQAGLLSFRPSRRATAHLLGWAKDAALTRIPPKMRETLFRSAERALPGWLESRARFGEIDFPKTRAFSEELNYFPSVSLHLMGREPHGTVRPQDVEKTHREVEDALLALRDPWTSAPVVREVWRREALFRGPFVDRAPDLILSLALDPHGQGLYSYGVAPTRGATAVFERLPPSEYLGRKGRSLPGSHRDHGLFIASGPSVPKQGMISAHIADVAPTVLARLGSYSIPESAGKPLAIHTSEDARTPLPEVERQKATGDDALVEARLRALGYIE